MGRSRRPDICIFCGELPCVCGKPAPVAKVPKPEKPATERQTRKPPIPPTPVEELINRHAFKPSQTVIPASRFEDTAPRTSKIGVISRAATRTQQNDDSMKRALGLLLESGMLHHSELPEIARELELDPYTVRLSAWKAARRRNG